MAYSDDPFPPTLFCQIALSEALDEIFNIPGAVRSHIFWHGRRHSVTGKLQKATMFFVYQTTRHGPRDGFCLCLVHEGFYIESESKREDEEGGEKDDIDRLESFIPFGHVEFFVLGHVPAHIR